MIKFRYHLLLYVYHYSMEWSNSDTIYSCTFIIIPWNDQIQIPSTAVHLSLFHGMIKFRYLLLLYIHHYSMEWSNSDTFYYCTFIIIPWNDQIQIPFITVHSSLFHGMIKFRYLLLLHSSLFHGMIKFRYLLLLYIHHYSMEWSNSDTFYYCTFIIIPWNDQIQIPFITVHSSLFHGMIKFRYLLLLYIHHYSMEWSNSDTFYYCTFIIIPWNDQIQIPFITTFIIIPWNDQIQIPFITVHSSLFHGMIKFRYLLLLYIHHYSMEWSNSDTFYYCTFIIIPWNDQIQIPFITVHSSLFHGMIKFRYLLLLYIHHYSMEWSNSDTFYYCTFIIIPWNDQIQIPFITVHSSLFHGMIKFRYHLLLYIYHYSMEWSNSDTFYYCTFIIIPWNDQIQIPFITVHSSLFHGMIKFRYLLLLYIHHYSLFHGMIKFRYLLLLYIHHYSMEWSNQIPFITVHSSLFHGMIKLRYSFYYCTFIIIPWNDQTQIPFITVHLSLFHGMIKFRYLLLLYIHHYSMEWSNSDTFYYCTFIIIPWNESNSDTFYYCTFIIIPWNDQIQIPSIAVHSSLFHGMIKFRYLLLLYIHHYSMEWSNSDTFYYCTFIIIPWNDQIQIPFITVHSSLFHGMIKFRYLLLLYIIIPWNDQTHYSME